MSYFYAECHDSRKNSHKFYELAHEPGSDLVVAEYGRLPGFGSRGTRVRFVYRCASPYGAVSTFERKVSEKLYKKGYVRERLTRTSPVRTVASTKTTVVAVSPDLIEQQLNVVLGPVETKKVEDTLARFRHLEMASVEEVKTAILQAAVLKPEEGKSKRFEHLDLDLSLDLVPVPRPPDGGKSKRFEHLDL